MDPDESRSRARIPALIPVEAAVTTIVDCEDSVAAVDAEDKLLGYRNWLGVIRGDLEATFKKGGKSLTRKLEDDVHVTCADGSELALPGRSLLLVPTNNLTDVLDTCIASGASDAVCAFVVTLADGSAMHAVPAPLGAAP